MKQEILSSSKGHGRTQQLIDKLRATPGAIMIVGTQHEVLRLIRTDPDLRSRIVPISGGAELLQEKLRGRKGPLLIDNLERALHSMGRKQKHATCAVLDREMDLDRAVAPEPGATEGAV